MDGGLRAGNAADEGQGVASTKVTWSRPVQRALLILVSGSLLGVVGQAALWGARAAPDRPDMFAERIDLNQASGAELQLLPGVGEHLARKIEDHRPFRTVEDLRQVPGIGAKTFARLRQRVTVGSPGRIESEQPDAALVQPSRRPSQAAPLTEAIPINTADPALLEQLPGIGPVLSKRIVAERTVRPFEKLQDLRRVKGIGPKTLAKIKPWIAF